MENSYYSVISPEGCSTILFKDAAQAPRAAEALRLTGADLLRLGIMDAVVPEPEGGAHTDPPAAAANVKTAIVSALRELVGTPVDQLLAEPLRALPQVRRSRPAHPSADRGERMTDSKQHGSDPFRLGGGAAISSSGSKARPCAGSRCRRARRRSRSSGAPPVSRWLPRPAPAAAAAAPAAAEGEPELDGRHPIVAPLVGTFYRASAPGAKPFVEEGDVVDEGQTVAIVEAMKLMNQVKADQGGQGGRRSSCTDGDWVEFEQPLMLPRSRLPTRPCFAKYSSRTGARSHCASCAPARSSASPRWPCTPLWTLNRAVCANSADASVHIGLPADGQAQLSVCAQS